MTMLTGEEIAALAKRMTECTDPAEALTIREEIVRGFYGTDLLPNDTESTNCPGHPKWRGRQPRARQSPDWLQ